MAVARFRCETETKAGVGISALAAQFVPGRARHRRRGTPSAGLGEALEIAGEGASFEGARKAPLPHVRHHLLGTLPVNGSVDPLHRSPHARLPIPTLAKGLSGWV